MTLLIRFTAQWKRERIALLLEGIKASKADVVVLQEAVPWCFSSALIDGLTASANELGLVPAPAPPASAGTSPSQR